MRIDFSAILLNLNDSPLMQPPGPNGSEVPATLAWVASGSAPARDRGERTGRRSTSCTRSRSRVGAGGEVELKSEDVALIKTKIGEQFAPLVVGRAFDLLEPPVAVG